MVTGSGALPLHAAVEPVDEIGVSFPARVHLPRRFCYPDNAVW